MPDDSTPKFELRQNGPLVVKGLTSMKGADGAEIEVKPVMALCRCGHSNTKPFCDGSHNKVGFQSEGGTPAGLDKLIVYNGDEATITYNPRLCSHAAECGRIASHVFNPAEKPWVQPDNGSLHELEMVVAACPSGALAFQNQGRDHRIADRAEVEVEPNGPYWVTGAEVDATPPGKGASPDKYVLCRCGLSGNKPYCDGTHRDEGWQSGD